MKIKSLLSRLIGFLFLYAAYFLFSESGVLAGYVIGISFLLTGMAFISMNARLGFIAKLSLAGCGLCLLYSLTIGNVHLNTILFVIPVAILMIAPLVLHFIPNNPTYSPLPTYTLSDESDESGRKKFTAIPYIFIENEKSKTPEFTPADMFNLPLEISNH